MTDTLRFSLVVPAHDEADLLLATLASLHAQDFQGGYEVIVVDNASRDGTAALAEALGVRVLREPQLGVCRARQRLWTWRTGRSSAPPMPTPDTHPIG